MHCIHFKVDIILTVCRALRNFPLSFVEVKNGLLNVYLYDSVAILTLVPNAFGVAEEKISW